MRPLILKIPAIGLLPLAAALAQAQPAPGAGPALPPAAPAVTAARALVAGTPTATQALTSVTLAEALQAARQNPDIAWARQAVASARGDLQAADRAPLPTLSAKAASIDLDKGIGPGHLLRDKRIDKGLGLDWTVERGNKRALRTEGARQGVAAAGLDLAEALVQQQQQTAAAYFDLLAAQERLQEVTALARGAADLAEAGQRRLRAGDIAQQDALRTEIEARRAQAEQRAAEADLARARSVLARLTGLAGSLQAMPAGLPADTAAPAAPGAPSAQAMNSAQAAQEAPATPVSPTAAGADPLQRADVRAAQARVDAARLALDSAIALRRNDVTVGTAFNHQPGTSRSLLEFRVQMPLAGVLGTYHYEGEIARARAGLEQAQAQLEKVQRAALDDHTRLLADLREASSRSAQFQEAIVPRARQVAGMAELAYSKGAMPLVDLIDARRTLRAVLLDDIAARADHARAAWAWHLRQAPANP